MAELINFNFPQIPGSCNDLNNVLTGFQHVQNTALNIPIENYGSVIAFKNDYYVPQLYISYDSDIYIRGSLANEFSPWKKILTEDV